MKKLLRLLLSLAIVTSAVAAPNQFKDTRIGDDYSLTFGNDDDIGFVYDELTDNRLEIKDPAGNLMGHVTDAGTAGNWQLTGTLGVTGAATLSSTLGVTGVVTASSASNAIRIGTASDLTTPPAIGGTTPAAGTFTTIEGTTSIKAGDDDDYIAGADNDIRWRYDEVTDNRLEWHDGTNLLLYLTDAGTTGDLGVTGNATATGTVTASSDADSTHVFGRAKIGSPTTDNATFAHFDNLSTTNYALKQAATGATAVNSATGVDVSIAQNGTVHSTFNAATHVFAATGSISLTTPIVSQQVSANTSTLYKVINVNTGTAANAYIGAGNADSAAASTLVLTTGTSYTASGMFKQDAGVVYANSSLSGGLSLGAPASGADVRIYARGSADGNLVVTFGTDATWSEGVDQIYGTTTGTMHGTATTQKQSWWGATPIVQPAHANQAVLALDTTLTGGDTVDQAAIEQNFTDVQARWNQLRSDLVAAGIIKGAA